MWMQNDRRLWSGKTIQKRYYSAVWNVSFIKNNDYELGKIMLVIIVVGSYVKIELF